MGSRGAQEERREITEAQASELWMIFPGWMDMDGCSESRDGMSVEEASECLGKFARGGCIGRGIRECLGRKEGRCEMSKAKPMSLRGDLPRMDVSGGGREGCRGRYELDKANPGTVVLEWFTRDGWMDAAAAGWTGGCSEVTHEGAQRKV